MGRSFFWSSVGKAVPNTEKYVSQSYLHTALWISLSQGHQQGKKCKDPSLNWKRWGNQNETQAWEIDLFFFASPVLLYTLLKVNCQHGYRFLLLSKRTQCWFNMSYHVPVRVLTTVVTVFYLAPRKLYLEPFSPRQIKESSDPKTKHFQIILKD